MSCAALASRGVFLNTHGASKHAKHSHILTQNAEQICDILIIYHAPLFLDVPGGASVVFRLVCVCVSCAARG